MGTSLANVTTEASRKAAYNAAVAATPNAAVQAVVAQNALQEHFCRAIKAWAARSGDAPGVTVNEFRFREALINADVLITWAGQLQDAGYTVTRTNGFFVISLVA